MRSCVSAYVLVVAIVGYSQSVTQSSDAFQWSVFSYTASVVLGLAIFWLTQGRSFSEITTGLWLGEVSYSMYLIHPLGYHLLDNFVGPPILHYSTYLVVALMLSAFLYYVVERPSQRLGRRRKVEVRREAD